MPAAFAKHRPRYQPAPQPRKSAYKRGYTPEWQRESKAFLAEHPWCAACAAKGHRVPATCVDHHVPHKGNPALFWDRDNWRPSCASHNSSKCAREEGGFGNPVKR